MSSINDVESSVVLTQIIKSSAAVIVALETYAYDTMLINSVLHLDLS